MNVKACLWTSDNRSLCGRDVTNDTEAKETDVVCPKCKTELLELVRQAVDA